MIGSCCDVGRGAGRWLWIGPEMIHLMELPNPDPMEGRPEHGGRDRHVCIGVHSVSTPPPLHSRAHSSQQFDSLCAHLSGFGADALET